MENKVKKKSVVYKITISVIILIFLDQCTLINITTSDIFRPSYHKNSKQLTQKITSEKYELVPVYNRKIQMYTITNSNVHFSAKKTSPQSP